MYKRSVIVGDIRRAYDTSSSFQIFDKNLRKYRAKWKNNQFPVSFTNNLERQSISNIIDPTPKSSQNEKSVTIKLHLARHLRRFLSNI